MSNFEKDVHSVLAIVVTFNRPNILALCVNALLRQIKFGLERIHVIVNSQDDDTKTLLHQYKSPLVTFEFLNNPGPAGGFNVGLERFLNGDYTHVWLMDDDVVVQGNCLEELLVHAKHEGYIYPRVISGDGRDLLSYGWWGVMLSRQIVEQVGLPITELFYWTEDTEYLQHRLRRVNKIIPFRCEGAVVKHLHLRTTKRPSWYYYYVPRNTLYYRKYILQFNMHSLRLVAQTIFILLFRITFKERRKVKKIALMVLGIYHGLVGKIGKLIDPASNR